MAAKRALPAKSGATRFATAPIDALLGYSSSANEPVTISPAGS
jgi:hypothetical protein